MEDIEITEREAGTGRDTWSVPLLDKTRLGGRRLQRANCAGRIYGAVILTARNSVAGDSRNAVSWQDLCDSET